MISPADVVRTPRRAYIDWLRGLAVLIMIEAHTVDAWLHPAARTGVVFRDLTILGGFAAPLFLWVAGLALVLSAERTLERTKRRSDAAVAIACRGLEIFILAFLFRIQAFVVSPGSWLITVFRVDILNVMGPAIVVAGLVWGVAGTSARAATATGLLATLVTLVTPLIRTAAWVDGLPLWVQWYVRPVGDSSTFTLFPWAGFVFAGACVGTALAAARNDRAERWLLSGLTLSGALVLVLGLFTANRPALYANGSFWTTSPSFFAIRIGLMTLALTAAWMISPLARFAPRFTRILSDFGRNSLFIYWIHVELVYGYATWVIHRRLPLAVMAGAYVAFCTLMYAAIPLRDRAVLAWRARRAGKGARAMAAA